MNTPIEKEQLGTLRSQLNDRLSVLVSEVRSQLETQTGESYGDLSSQVRDLGDEAAADVLIDSRLFDIQRDAEEMREIRAALVRMEDRSYGICVDCGEPIALQRLEAQPAASRCMDCQRRYEHEHTRTNPREI